MAVAQWHGGKLVLLWVGVAFAFLLATAAHSDATTVVVLFSAAATFVVTWKWLSAHERRPLAEAAIAREATDRSPNTQATTESQILARESA